MYKILHTIQNSTGNINYEIICLIIQNDHLPVISYCLWLIGFHIISLEWFSLIINSQVARTMTSALFWEAVTAVIGRPLYQTLPHPSLLWSDKRSPKHVPFVIIIYKIYVFLYVLLVCIYSKPLYFNESIHSFFLFRKNINRLFLWIYFLFKWNGKKFEESIFDISKLFQSPLFKMSN